MAKADHLTEYGERLHVHHIIPARQFDDPEPRNAMGNLITLCREDHAKWEGVPLRPHRAD
jgi:predicted HNH restriction endonuclease